MSRFAVSLTSLAVAAAACGTTVPAADQVYRAGPDGLGAPGSAVDGSMPSEALVAPGSAGLGGSPAGATGTAGATGSTVTAPRSGVGQAGAASSQAGPATGGAASTGTRVVPPGGSIVVGFPTRKDGAAAASAVGIQGASTGDQENQMRAIAAAINARGGILGRKVVLAPHDTPALESSSNPDAADAASCAAWVDKKAFVVVNVTVRATLRDCLGKAGIPIISSLSISSGASVFRDVLPGVYAPSAMSIDRSATAVIDRLVTRQFFTGWDHANGRPGPFPVRIGMQSFEGADGQHVVDVVRKALAEHGLKLDVVEAHSSDLNDNSSSTSAAVLRFRAEGVTHVIDANLIFFQTAESQDYHPRYVIQDTINTPALLAQNVSASQLHGSMGAGYLPLYEVDDPQDTSAEATRCKALMRAAGEDVRQPIALALMLHACDATFFLEEALTAAGSVSAVALRSGSAALGAVPSHLTYGSQVTADRRDGATRIRDFEYVDDCTCFRHSSATTYPVP